MADDQKQPPPVQVPPPIDDEFFEPSPTLPRYFAGYALLFVGIVGFAALLGFLMKVLR